jgi:peptidoglycan DL-endopeptidase CwlO
MMPAWKASGAAWLAPLASAEVAAGLPMDLLVRIAYQESHFVDSIIYGTKASPAGALGMMQLMPQYFQSVRAPVPYSYDDIVAQISEAAAQLESLHNQLGTWELAIAGYNAGAGAVKKYGGVPPFAETRNYVAEVTADVPGLDA